MSVTAFLDLVRQRFSPSDGKIIVESLSQDPLVWQFVQEDKTSLPYFKSAAEGLQAYLPGSIAIWLIEQKLGISLPQIKDLTQKLPDLVRQNAARAFQMHANTGLPPVDLLSAGLIALALRERRIIEGSWEGISEELLKKPAPDSAWKHYETWRTPFACLPAFCPDFGELIAELNGSNRPSVLRISVPLYLHAILANPIQPDELIEQLFEFAKTLPVSSQLACLRWLEGFGRKENQQSLAGNLMQTRDNQSFFAKLFSDAALIDSASPNGDPLDKTIPFSLPERMNQLAAFHYHSGDEEKAAAVYQQACDLIGALQSQTRYQALSLKGDQVAPSAWLKLTQSLPNSKKARLLHIQSLIRNQKLDEAKNQLEKLPESSENHLLDLLLENHTGKDSINSETMEKLIPFSTCEKNLLTPEYFIRTANIIHTEEWLPLIHSIQDPQQKASAISRLIQKSPGNIALQIFARDELEQTGFYDQALEVASLLEREQPKVIDHQRALARLLAKTSHWEQAFSISRKLVREMVDPEIQDLTTFAEASLMTGQVDMAVSICQNILTQEQTNPQALILLGKSYLEKGDVVKAIQHMEQVVAMIPEDPQTWIHLARFWESSGQTERAFEILRQGILAIPDDPDLLQEFGLAHLEKGSPSEARVYLKKAFEKAPSNPEVRRHLAQAEFLTGNHNEALALIEPISDGYETDITLARLFSDVLIALGELEKALPVLLSAAQQDPFDQKTVLAAADLILGPGTKQPFHQHNEAIEALEKILQSALEEYPDDHQLKLRFADLNRLKGRYEEAYQAYTQLASNDSHQKDFPNWRIQYGIGLTSSALGDIEIGLAALQDAAHHQPENLQVLHALAETYAQAELPVKALESAKTALEAAPQNIENLIWFAQFNSRNNQYEEALQALRRAREYAPERLDIHFLYAKTLNQNGAVEESVDHLDDLISHDEVTPTLLHPSAYLYIQSQDLDRALIALEKALGMSKGSPTTLLLMDLAVLYMHMDQKKKALEILDLPANRLETSPALAMLRSDLLSQIGQYKPALQILDHLNAHQQEAHQEWVPDGEQFRHSPLLIQYDFSYTGYLFRRGQLTRAIGKPQVARSVLEQASRLAPDDHKIQNALVGACIAALDREKALETSEIFNPLGVNPKNFDLDQLDLICARAEIFLDQKQRGPAEKILTDPTLLQQKYPRLSALKSRHAAMEGSLPEARKYAAQAIENYQANIREMNPASPSECFRIQANLQGIADAHQEIENVSAAHHYQKLTWEILNNQADHNLRYLGLIVQSAEKQRIAQAIKLSLHAPGPEFLEDRYYQLGKELIESLNDFLSAEKIQCLQARLTSAFSGTWPSFLTGEHCLDTPQVGASFILGCGDESQVQKIVHAFPNELAVLQAAAVFSIKTGRGDGNAMVDKVLEIDTANPINHALKGWLNIQEPDLAVHSFETALQFWPEEPDWHKILADLYSELGETETAANHISLAIEKDPDNSAYWQTAAEIHLQLNQLDQAKSDLEKSTQLKSQDASSWVRMADVNRRLGNVSEAVKNIRTAASLEPKDSAIAIQELEFLLNQGHYQEAAEKAAMKIQQNGDHPKFRILLARSRSKMGDFERALEALSADRESSTSDPEIALEALKIKQGRDGVEKTLPELIRLAGKQPNHPETLKTLTDWLIQTNRLAEAQETAQTILRILPESAEVSLMLGRLQRLNGQLDQAIAHLSDAIAHDPELVDAYIELGKSYQDRNDLEEAIKIFQMATKVDASDPRPYYHAGLALKARKDYSGAEVMLKQAKKYSPTDANIIRQLGVISALNLINNLREAR